MANDLRNYFDNNKDRIIIKWDHYFEIYEKHFSRFRDREVVVVEIGVSQGGSLQMWKNYFGPKARIYGIDIDPRCKDFEEENVQVFIGSQSDRRFLNELKQKIPAIDILIDDGGHTMKQQIVTFEEMFSHIRKDGIYFCEDCHTSYWWEFGGGYKRPGTFLEYSKRWIDYINAHHSQSSRLKVNEVTNTAKCLYYYDSIVVIEKGEVKKPIAVKSGLKGFAYTNNRTLGTRVFERLTLIYKRLTGWLKLPYRVE